MSGGARVEIEAITKNLIRAYNNGTLSPPQFYTEDCQLLIPGRQPVHGHKGMEGLFDRNIQQLVVYDEIGPEDATDLAFSRGSFILYTKKEEIVSSGRFVSIWKKVDGKWLIHRDIPMTDNKFKKEEYQDLLVAERQAVESFNDRTFTPVKYCTKDCVMMAISKEIVRGYKGIKGVYEKHRFNNGMKQITAVESIILDKSLDYAITRGYFLLHNGQWESVRSGRFSSMWKKENGQWQLYRDFPDIDQYRLAKTLENDHKGVRAAGIHLLAAYNSGEVDPSAFYTTDCQLIPPRGEAYVDYNSISQVLKQNKDHKDSRRRVIGVAHEIITNSEDNFAYEKGHYMNYSRDGDILSGGEYVTLWKKVNDQWLIYRDIPHIYYMKDQWEPDIFNEIRVAADKIVDAYNSGKFSISDFYTRDCVIALPGQKLSGHKAVERVYSHSADSNHVQVQVVDEIGPLTATNLCYIKGVYSMQTTLGEVAHSGRYECILKKIDGKWLNCRDMPK